MKKTIAILVTVATLVSCCTLLSGCSGGSSGRDMGYHTRSDGTRVWYYK